MPLSKIGFNISGLSNVTLPEFNISDTPKEFVEQMPEVANNVTGNFYGLGVLITLFFYVFWRLTDLKSDFSYSKIRGLSIASAICSIMGGVMISIGYFTEIYYVIFFMVICLLSFIWVFVEER